MRPMNYKPWNHKLTAGLTLCCRGLGRRWTSAILMGVSASTLASRAATWSREQPQGSQTELEPSWKVAAATTNLWVIRLRLSIGHFAGISTPTHLAGKNNRWEVSGQELTHFLDSFIFVVNWIDEWIKEKVDYACLQYWTVCPCPAPQECTLVTVQRSRCEIKHWKINTLHF